MNYTNTTLILLVLATLLPCQDIAAESMFTGSIRTDCVECERRYLGKTKILIDEAARIAARDGHGRVVAIELETEGGYLVYNAEVVRTNHKGTIIGEIDVIVDPQDGKVLFVDGL